MLLKSRQFYGCLKLHTWPDQENLMNLKPILSETLYMKSPLRTHHKTAAVKSLNVPIFFQRVEKCKKFHKSKFLGHLHLTSASRISCNWDDHNLKVDLNVCIPKFRH